MDKPTAKKLAQLYEVLNPVKVQQWLVDTQKELWKELEPSPRTINLQPLVEATG